MNSLRSWDAAYERGALAWRGTTNFEPKPALRKGSRVLELGCGNGKTASALSLQPVELHAIDVSPTAAKLCAELVKRVGGKAVVKQMDGLSLNYKDGFFDAVVAFHYFAHFYADERLQAVREARRVLKKGGKLYFKEFGSKDFRNGKGAQVEEKTFKRGKGIITHYFTIGEAKELLKPLTVETAETENWTVCLRGVEYARQLVKISAAK